MLFSFFSVFGRKSERKRPQMLVHSGRYLFVRMTGLEPTRLAASDPKSDAATNYATSAAPFSAVQR